MGSADFGTEIQRKLLVPFLRYLDVGSGKEAARQRSWLPALAITRGTWDFWQVTSPLGASIVSSGKWG